MKSDASSILQEISFEEERERAEENIKEFEKTKSILDKKIPDFSFLSRPPSPGIMFSDNSPGYNPITKEQKIEIVNRALDDLTLCTMQNGDKIKYFDENIGSLISTIREVLG